MTTKSQSVAVASGERYHRSAITILIRECPCSFEDVSGGSRPFASSHIPEYASCSRYRGRRPGCLKLSIKKLTGCRMTGLKPRVSRQRDTPADLPRVEPLNYNYAHSETTSQSRSDSRPGDTRNVPSLISPNEGPDHQPSLSWNSDAAQRDSVPIHQELQTPDSATRSWQQRSVSGAFTNGSASTPRSAPTKRDDWTPAGLSGQGPTSGFLGSTSFSAVFDENHNKIGMVSTDETSGITETHVECLSSREHESKIKAGAAVLTQLADFKHLTALISRWLEYAKGLSLVSSYFACLFLILCFCS